jgi:hypothetical protein
MSAFCIMLGPKGLSLALISAALVWLCSFLLTRLGLTAPDTPTLIMAGFSSWMWAVGFLTGAEYGRRNSNGRHAAREEWNG